MPAVITHGGTLPATNVDRTDFYAIIDNATISGLDGTNVNVINTAGKVTGASLTALNGIPSAAGRIPAANTPTSVTLPEITAPSTAASTGALYTKDTGGQPELFFREESDGDEVQLTNGGVVNGGAFIQYISATEADVVDCPTAIPLDDSIPTTSEGTKISDLSLTITPTSASSKIVIEGVINAGQDTASDIVIATIVKNGDAGASAVFASTAGDNGRICSIPIYYEESAGSTDARTYDFYVGASTGDATVNGNGDGSTRLFGGKSICRVSVKEIV